MTDSSEKSNNFQVCDRDLSSETLERYLKADALFVFQIDDPKQNGR